MKSKIIFLMVWLVGVLSGVASGHTTPVHAAIFTADDTNNATLARQHVFMVDKEGECLDPAILWDWTDKHQRQLRDHSLTLSNSLHQIEGGIQAWRTNRAANPPPRVVVFVHGGMNPYSASQDRLRDANFLNALAASNCYPIFVVWNSGPFSSYAQHLWSIRQGEKCDSLERYYVGPLTSPLILISDLLRGLVRMPTTLVGRLNSDRITAELPNGHAVKNWENFDQLLTFNDTNSGLRNFPTFHPPQSEGNKRDWWERGIHLAEYIVTQPTKIVTLPILDGMGTEAWDIMQRRTRTMFEATDSHEIGRLIKDLNNYQKAPTNKPLVVHRWLDPIANDELLAPTNAQRGAMYFLSQEFAEWSTNQWLMPDGKSNSVAFEFYGHSMGSIVLNQMFRNDPRIQANRIVYLAAACSIEDFKTALFPYLTAHPQTKFYSLSLYRLRERDEFPLKMPVPFARDLIVRGSLLNWIDDILAKPNSITDRTMGTWENMVRALPDIPNDLRPRTFFRECDLEPQAAWSGGEGTFDPQVHGDFTRTIFWSPNFLWPTENKTNQLVMRKQ